MTKCLGCGAILQDTDTNKAGYTKSLDNSFCERCFQIKHYNKYLSVPKKPQDYLKIANDISKTGDLVVLITDFLNLYNLDSLDISNPVLLVISKRDLFPRSLDEDYFLKRLSFKLNICDKLFVCAKNNYHLDELYNKINKYKVSSNVYVLGYTNAGKSTLINKMMKNYSSSDGNITTSILPSTTLDLIYNKVNDDLVLIDTPGLLDEGSIILHVNESLINKILPKKEIRPIIYQIKNKQTILINDLVSIEVCDNDITIFMSNDLKIQRFYDKKPDAPLKIYEVNVLANQDLVIKGLGFIRFKKPSLVRLGLIEKVDYLVRNSTV